MLNRYSLRNIADRVVLNREPVTFFHRSGGTDTFTAYPLSASKRKKQSDAEADVGLVTVDSGSLVWQFWQRDLDAAGAPSPVIEDYLTDAAGDRWYFVKVKQQLMGNVWEMTCTSGTA